MEVINEMEVAEMEFVVDCYVNGNVMPSEDFCKQVKIKNEVLAEIARDIIVRRMMIDSI